MFMYTDYTQHLLDNVKKIHFIGCGGSGMYPLIQILSAKGYDISGSDVLDGSIIRYEREMGVKVTLGHSADNVVGADLVVYSAAIAKDNVELNAAASYGITTVERSVLLGYVSRLYKQSICVSGTHGKTTTTSLTASLLAAGDLDPTFVIGGRLNSAGANARLGTGEFLVAEADESDASFLNLTPVISAVTNIDEDHMDTYGHSFENLKSAFVDFLERLPFYGVAVLCADDEHVLEIRPRVTKPVILYGLSADAQVRAIDVRAVGTQMAFTILRPDHPPLPVVLNLPGIHNVRNALAAVAIATVVGVSDEAIVRGLSEFRGVGRRFTQYGDIPVRAADGSVTGHYKLIDDYGHHPHEMAATLAAVRGAWPEKHVIVAFQPHRYTRTRDCFEQFVDVLKDIDGLVLAEVYPAGEALIEGADSEHLAAAIAAKGFHRPVVVPVEGVADAIAGMVRDGDVVITMGAGSIGRVAPAIADGAK